MLARSVLRSAARCRVAPRRAAPTQSPVVRSLPQVSVQQQVFQGRLFAQQLVRAFALPSSAPIPPRKLRKRKQTMTEEEKLGLKKEAAVKKEQQKAEELPGHARVAGWGEDGFTPGNVAIKPMNIKLRDLVFDKKYDEAKQLFSKMKAEGPAPNVPTYNIMVNLYRVLGDYKSIEIIMKERDSVFKRKPKKPASARARVVITGRPYHPKPKSAPWALLVGLQRFTSAHPDAKNKGVGREELIEASQGLCDVSLVTPDDYNGFYSGWACMATLVQKGLVERDRKGGKGTRYLITSAGAQLVEELEKEWEELKAAAAADSKMAHA